MSSKNTPHSANPEFSDQVGGRDNPENNDFSEYSWSTIAETTARLEGTEYLGLWRTTMQDFMDSRVPITETREGLHSLVSNSSVPLPRLQSMITPFLALPMTTQKECDEARSQLSTILDSPVIERPPNSLTLEEALKFNEDLKQLGSKKHRQFWETCDEVLVKKRNTKEGMEGRMILEQLLEENTELLEPFNRFWGEVDV